MEPSAAAPAAAVPSARADDRPPPTSVRVPTGGAQTRAHPAARGAASRRWASARSAAATGRRDTDTTRQPSAARMARSIRRTPAPRRPARRRTAAGIAPGRTPRRVSCCAATGRRHRAPNARTARRSPLPRRRPDRSRRTGRPGLPVRTPARRPHRPCSRTSPRLRRLGPCRSRARCRRRRRSRPPGLTPARPGGAARRGPGRSARGARSSASTGGGGAPLRRDAGSTAPPIASAVSDSALE